MNKSRASRLTSLLLLLALPHMTHAQVQLSEPVRANFGIATTAATAVQVPQQWQAAAQVLDASPLLSSLADLHAAQAVAAASAAELQRLEALYKADNAALKSVEAARAQAIGDNAKVTSLQAQLLGTWGAALLRMQTSEREQLTHGILAGKQVLIRAEVAGNAPHSLTPHAVRIQLADHAPLDAKLLGAMPLVNTQAVGKAYLLSAEITDRDLQPGETLTVTLQDTSHSIAGIAVPRAAVVRWQGQQWAYVEQAMGHYQRMALNITQWSQQGALVSGGIKAGDKLVTTGAGLLLGVELSPAATKE